MMNNEDSNYENVTSQHQTMSHSTVISQSQPVYNTRVKAPPPGFGPQPHHSPASLTNDIQALASHSLSSSAGGSLFGSHGPISLSSRHMSSNSLSASASSMNFHDSPSNMRSTNSSRSDLASLSGRW